MRPHLRDGKPVGSRPRKDPDPYILCQCSECSSFGWVTTPNGSVAGRLFDSDAALKDHKDDIKWKSRMFAHNDLQIRETVSVPSSPTAANPLPNKLANPDPVFGSGSSKSITIPNAIFGELPMPSNAVKDSSPQEGSLPYERKQIEQIRARLKQLSQSAEPKYWEGGDIKFEEDPTLVQTLLLEPEVALDRQHSGNSHLRAHQAWLQENSTYVKGLHDRLGTFHDVHFRLMVQSASSELSDAAKQCCEGLKMEWKRQWNIHWVLKRPRVVAKTLSFSDFPIEQHAFLAMMLLTAVLSLLSGLSMDHARFLLGSLRVIAAALGSDRETYTRHIPSDARTALNRLSLSPEPREFVCCPKCFQLYGREEYPERCTGMSSPTSARCNRRLRRPYARDSNREHPARTFQFNDLTQWIAWMYSRPEIERTIDHRHGQQSTPRGGGFVNDIWDAEIVHELEGPDGKLFLHTQDPSEGRLLFNLNCDYFSPYGNRQSGKKLSVGGLYLVCLNLPPSLRYKVENMFLVGVVPGPKEPSQQQVNYILRPLVDDLLKLWQEGIYLDRTPLFTHGRIVRAALVALVCDLPAARLLGGFAHHMDGENPCSMCDVDDLENLDESKYTSRTEETHRFLADAWLEANSDEQRAELFKRHGIRWSELLRLPYWDPVRNTIIDSMHCFYLRILQRHCRDIWGMGVRLQDGNGLWEVEEPSDGQKETASTTFRHGSSSALKQLNTACIRWLASREGLDHRLKKKTLLPQLLSLRVKRQWFNEDQTARLSADNDVAVAANESIVGQRETALESGEHDVPAADRTLTEIEEAREEFRIGRTKQGLSRFNADIIRQLASEVGAVAFTKAGKDSRAKNLLIDSLVEQRETQRKNLAALNPTHAHTMSAPADTAGTGTPTRDRDALRGDDSQHLSNDQEKLQILQSATKTAINRMDVASLRALCAFTVEHAKLVLAARRDGIARNREEMDNLRILLEDNPDIDVEETGDSLSDVDSQYSVLTESDSGQSEAEALEDERDPNTLTADQLKKWIHSKRAALGYTDRKGKVVKKLSRRKEGVLGKKTLAEIRSDMAASKLPSWVPIAPSHPGEADHGKFTADQWRSFCTINLPVTLIRLWGSKPEGSREREMLDNFMHLVTAVRLANMRSMSEERISAFEREYRMYLHGLRGLYDHTNITPYQHMALHFGMLLRRFGPVHSWRCFAFERYNYLLQNIPHNSRFGDLEKTLFNRFCMMQKLRSVFHPEALPPSLTPMISAFSQVFESDVRGTRVEDALPFDEYFNPVDEQLNWESIPTKALINLDDVAFAQLCAWVNQDNKNAGAVINRRVFLRRRLKRLDLVFTTVTESFADAQVVFEDENQPSGWAAGSIKSIFSASWVQGPRHTKTFALINPYKPLASIHIPYDHYRRYGQAGGCLYYQRCEAPCVIDFDKIRGHFGHTIVKLPGLRARLIHALPQEKVLWTLQ